MKNDNGGGGGRVYSISKIKDNAIIVFFRIKYIFII